jgi:hypothetical protein
VEDQDLGEFFVSMSLRHRLTNFIWEMITVYGPAQHARAHEFIAELSKKCVYAALPVVFGGDLNLIRIPEEKNNGNMNQGLMDRFNMFIDFHQLQKIRSGPKFTWTNKHANPVMVTLDRILVSIEWKAKYPLCFAWSKTRVGLDHWSIFLDYGEGSMNKQKQFFFEKQWLMEPDLLSSIKFWENSENKVANKHYSLDRWQGCLSLTRQALRGWSANRGAKERKMVLQ